MVAQTSQTLETERKGERFTLIEPPQLPEKPAKPNRLAIALLGSMLSFAGGIGSTAIAEAMDPTIRGRAALTGLVGVPPLAVIPEIISVADVRSRAFVRAIVFAALIMSIILGLLAVHSFVEPLDVLWFAALRKFGL